MGTEMRKPVPSNAGQRLIPAVIDELASIEPDRVIYEYAIGATVSDGMEKVTMKAYSNAINRTAWWLENHLGKSKTFEPLGYIGPGMQRFLFVAVIQLICSYR